MPLLLPHRMVLTASEAYGSATVCVSCDVSKKSCSRAQYWITRRGRKVFRDGGGTVRGVFSTLMQGIHKSEKLIAFKTTLRLHIFQFVNVSYFKKSVVYKAYYIRLKSIDWKSQYLPFPLAPHGSTWSVNERLPWRRQPLLYCSQPFSFPFRHSIV